MEGWAGSKIICEDVRENCGEGGSGEASALGLETGIELGGYEGARIRRKGAECGARVLQVDG